MISESTTWHGGYSPTSLAYEFLAIKTTQSGRFFIETTFNLLPIEDNIIVPSPTLAMYAEEAQTLLDAMWNSGLRPRDGTGGLAHTNAQAAHIADLRAIVMKKCGIPQ